MYGYQIERCIVDTIAVFEGQSVIDASKFAQRDEGRFPVPKRAFVPKVMIKARFLL
jgi:hypothetical protein